MWHKKMKYSSNSVLQAVDEEVGIESDSQVSSKTESNIDNSEGRSSNELIHPEIAANESKVVNRLRILVLFVLFLASVLVSVIVYLITSISQKNEFVAQYNGMATQIVNTFNGIASQKISVLGSLRVSIMAYALDQKSVLNGNTSSTRDWPFITVSLFQQRAATVRKLSNSLYIGLYPVVQETERSEWETYAALNKNLWMGESLQYQENSNFTVFGSDEINLTEKIEKLPILNLAAKEVETQPGPYVPFWQMSPIVNSVINVNSYNATSLPQITLCHDTGKAVIGRFRYGPAGDIHSDNGSSSFYAGLLSTAEQAPVRYEGDPFSSIVLPIYGSYRKNDTKAVAMLSAVVQWGAYFKNVLPEQALGLNLVLNNKCDGPWSYIIYGNRIKFMGQGDLHQQQFDEYEYSASFETIDRINDGTEYGVEFMNDFCPVTLHVYPSEEYYNQFSTNMPIIMTMTVLIVFVFAVAMFLVYDRLVERRQKLVLTRAIQSSAVVESLFPRNVADKIMQQAMNKDATSNQLSSKNKLKSMINNEHIISGSGLKGEDSLDVKPIAELFPHTTVMFADIAGFTAWSSTREPTQVFLLLQGVYKAFDVIAKRRRVFKVETIGDSYVAVTGVPDPQENHAVIMARFAVDCQQKMSEVTNVLELQLGPGTSELTMRIGLHSGPVTGGVLMGDKARFQLFGDTVNTAARMESTGIKQKIQISSTTAALVIAAGKSHWVIPRDDHVNVKGKGILHTYWLNTQPSIASNKAFSEGDKTSNESDCMEESNSVKMPTLKTEGTVATMKSNNHVSWICELLMIHIKNVVANRTNGRNNALAKSNFDCHLLPKTTPIDEVVEAIVLPEFKDKKVYQSTQSNEIALDDTVVSQLRQLISILAKSYNDNPFHNFEHACHVTMSVNKLLMRVVSPDLDLEMVESNKIASHLHDYTHGINSDPITQLALLFSAVIHDVDHRGVSNDQLIREEIDMASIYKNKSVAEQNSLDIAWKLLMMDSFADLRRCIFETNEELCRFRQVVVNAVMATDIMDKELNDLRKYRWEKAFSPSTKFQNGQEKKNLQATIVIEHLMQASDVAHTMQHWHVYRKWNANLFKEIYFAYRSGRVRVNPSDFWYDGELRFFDNYVMPLARKLQDCNVFGVSSDEYLNYAQKNRAEWEVRGRELVAEMIAELEQENELDLRDI